MTTDYNINNVDLDDSPYNFSSYINVSDGNYTNISVLNITARKTVIFGQNALTNVHPIGKLGNAFNTAQGVNVPKIDIDEASVLSTMPTAVVFSDTKKSQYYIRGNFALAENNANILATLEGVTYRLFPQSVGGNVAGTPQWSNMACGFRFIAALQSNGTLWSWGYNNNGQLGQGDVTFTPRSSPIQVGSSTTWTKITCGYDYVHAIQSNGTLWAWGYNQSGGLGLSDLTDRSFPTQVGNFTWNQTNAGNSHTLAIQSDGTLWAWGINGKGQLGLNTTTSTSSPVQVGSNLWKEVTCGQEFTLMIQSNGTLWSCGYNAQGQLGLNTASTPVSSPTQIGSLSTWTKITAGPYYAAAIQSNGTLWIWGNNALGQLGLNTNASQNRSSPTQIGALLWKQITAGGYHCLAIQSNGTLWSWGGNSWGQLGLSNQTDRSSPVQIGSTSTWVQVDSFSTSFCEFSSALQSNGTLWTWGKNDFAQLGDAIVFTSVTKPFYGV